MLCVAIWNEFHSVDLLCVVIDTWTPVSACVLQTLVFYGEGEPIKEGDPGDLKVHSPAVCLPLVLSTTKSISSLL